MSDLISRDAAIAAIEEEKRVHCALSPGIQAEKHKAFGDGLDSALAAINELPSPWIFVNDRLPEVNPENGNVMYKDGLPGYFCSVLACYVDGRGKKIVQPLSFYFERNNNPHWTVYNNVFHDWVFPVLYWMELPAPPSD